MWRVVRARWVEIFFIAFGMPFVLWAILGNPSSSDLVMWHGRPASLRVLPHVGGESLEFRIGDSRILQFNDTRQISRVRELLSQANDVEVQVWPGAAGPDRDIRGGEVVAIKIEGNSIMNFRGWWLGRLWQPILCFILGIAFLATGTFYMVRRPPIRLEGNPNPKDIDSRLVPLSSVSLMVGVLTAFSLFIYFVIFRS